MGDRTHLLAPSLLLLCSCLSPLTLASPTPTPPDRAVRRSLLSDAGESSIVMEGLKNGCASGLATICCKALLQPFDTLKTVQQASTLKLGLLDTVKGVVSERGVAGLYRGLPIALVGSVPAMSTYWAAYHTFRGVFNEMAHDMPKLCIVALSSAMANSVASVLRVPCEVIKQQVQTGLYQSAQEAIRALSASGISGFFLPGALVSQLARDVPFGVLTLCSFELLGAGARVPDVVQRVLNPSESVWRALCFGLATSLATLATNPMDVLKTRVMTQRAEGIATGWGAAVLRIWSAEGGGAFLKGALPRLLHKLPASTVFWLLYELFRNVLKVHVPPKRSKSGSMAA